MAMSTFCCPAKENQTTLTSMKVANLIRQRFNNKRMGGRTELINFMDTLHV